MSLIIVIFNKNIQEMILLFVLDILNGVNGRQSSDSIKYYQYRYIN